MTLLLRSSLAFLAVNAAGIAAFLLDASQFWIEPEVADVPGANVGNAFGWYFYALPIPAAFIASDLAWVALKLIAYGPNRARYLSIGLCLTALACWRVAYLFDNAHHGI